MRKTVLEKYCHTQTADDLIRRRARDGRLDIEYKPEAFMTDEGNACAICGRENAVALKIPERCGGEYFVCTECLCALIRREIMIRQCDATSGSIGAYDHREDVVCGDSGSMATF